MDVTVCQAAEAPFQRNFDVLMLIWPLPWHGMHGYDLHALNSFRGRFVVFLGLRDGVSPKQACHEGRYNVGSGAFLKRLRSRKHWTLKWRYDGLPSCPAQNYFPVLYLYERAGTVPHQGYALCRSHPVADRSRRCAHKHQPAAPRQATSLSKASSSALRSGWYRKAAPLHVRGKPSRASRGARRGR